MFESLSHTVLADAITLRPTNLPGFGAPPLRSQASLTALAGFVAATASETGSEVVVAHSVASIIASLAAGVAGSPITTILSLEGNLTAADAYFSGTAADYDDPGSFREAFLPRLEEMSRVDPIIDRYRDAVADADPLALWQLGKDARRFSDANHPGEVLRAAADVTYFYNPANCPQSTLDWLRDNPLKRMLLPGASHWPTIDQPEQLAQKMMAALRLSS